MPSGPDPHEIVADADGKRAYVSNYIGADGAHNTISVVDLAEHKALAPIDLGALRGPHGLDFAGGKVWFTAEAAKVIGSYDPVAQKVDWILGTGQNRTHTILDARISGKRDCRNWFFRPRFLFPNLAYQIVAIHLRHSNIANQHIKRFPR